ncbi:MAG: PQQ-binding-like beta-propeller repeat protein, partial [Pirellulales bacterium]|nr:PQQ-binding-like beta-propeller repeat protein [Pirellulales bacterium]
MKKTITTISSFRLSLSLAVTAAFVLALATWVPAPVAAQFGTDETEDEEESVEEKFPNGASVNTDPEVDRYLRLANQYAADKRFRPATRYLQRILSDFADVMVTRREWFFQVGEEAMLLQYKPVRLEVERMLAKLPAEGLQIYRVMADGEAERILAAAAPGKRQEALAKVVKNYFVSSVGDDAAFELGCLMLEQRNYIRAAYLFRRILDGHPDPSMSLDAVRLRLAVANARSGDLYGAKKQVKRLADADLEPTVFTAIENEVAIAAKATPENAGSEGWPMEFGTPSRTGHMKSLALGTLSEALTEKWAYAFQTQLNAGSQTAAKKIRSAPVHFRGRYPHQQTLPKVTSRAALVQRWKERGWTPTGRLRIHDGRIYTTGYFHNLPFKDAGNYILCLDATSGELLWRSFNGIKPDFEPYNQTTGDEIRLFGDRVANSIAIVGDTLYAIQGPQQSSSTTRMAMMRKDGMLARSREANSLVAYHAKSGKRQWTRVDDKDEEGSPRPIRFLAAPVPYGNQLLCPVRDDSGLWLMALDARDQGKTVWKSLLCDRPRGGASPWGTIGVAVEGGDVYVATGSGLVFALDAGTGETRWAIRYRRSYQNQPNQYVHGRTQQWVGLGVTGWDEDVVIPWRHVVIVLPTDADVIYGFDRRTGEINFKALRTTKDGTARYCLGVLGNKLYVGGNDVIRSFSLPGGRMERERRIEGGLGRACLTDKAIYVPVKDRVLQLDPESLETVADSAVTSLADDPVGNLFTDGTQIYGVGMERIYALMDVRQLLASLAKKIESGDVAAQLDRMRVRGKMGKLDAALEDLEAAYARLADGDPAERLRNLHDALAYLKLADVAPLKTVEWLKRGHADFAGSGTTDERPDEDSALSALLTTSLSRLSQQKPTEAASAILSTGDLLDDKSLRIAARDALEAVATPDDAGLLRESLKDKNEHTRAMAARALGILIEKDAVADLSPMLDDDSELVRAVAAHYLANVGERSSLDTLSKLLASEDIDIRVRTAKTLRSFTGQKFGFVAYETDASRQEAIKKWEEWIAASGKTAELRFPLPVTASEVGRTLVCLYSRKRIIEIDASGKQVWPKGGTVAEVNYPWDCQRLPNGNRLAVSMNGQQVVEFDDSGKRVWYKSGLPSGPCSVQRLENGNTLVACQGANKVIEFAGKQGRINMATDVKWELKKIDGRTMTGQPRCAQRLENGNTLVSLYREGRVVEVNREG